MGAAVAARLGSRPLLAVDRDTCDITSASDVSALVDQVDELGSLIVTAGLSPTMDDGRRIVEVNLVALDAVLRAFEPKLVPGSVAVVFASMAAHQIPVDPAIDAIVDDPSTCVDKLAGLGLLDHSGLAYAVSKRGVVRLVERLSKPWGARGARIVSVSPGVIDTPMAASNTTTSRSCPTWSPAQAWRDRAVPTKSPPSPSSSRATPPRSSPAPTSSSTAASSPASGTDRFGAVETPGNRRIGVSEVVCVAPNPVMSFS